MSERVTKRGEPFQNLQEFLDWTCLGYWVIYSGMIYSADDISKDKALHP